MKKRKTWRSKLTKAELKHLKEEAVEFGMRLTLDVLKTTAEVHAKMRRKNPDIEPCRTCKGIARKLGFEV